MKKAICCMLLCAMLCAAAGCTSKEADNETTNPADTTAADKETAETETETEKLLPDLPERDFEGYSYRGLVRGYIDSHWYTRDFYAEELTGEPINDAAW